MYLLDFLFPHRCVSCSKLGTYFCDGCRKKIELIAQRCPECGRPAIDGFTHPRCLKPWGLDGLISVFRYDAVVKKAIKGIKYRFVYDLAESLINLIPFPNYLAFKNLPKDPVVYPIPLHKDRLKWRGFNQAEKLGQFVAKTLKLKLVDGLLVRTANRKPQADISKRDDRIKNARGIFSLSVSFKTFVPQNILLFDDVWTTGATMKEATKVLKRGGIKNVWGMTIAR